MIIKYNSYGNGNRAISLFTDSGEPYATATVNIPMALNSDEVAIKDYSENIGVLDFLIESNVIEPQAIDYYELPYAIVPIHRLVS